MMFRKFTLILICKNMKILGIDPGTTSIGFGLLESKNNQLIFIKTGLIPLKKSDDQEKLTQIKKELVKIIQQHQPDCAGVEKIFFSKNAKTAIKVAQARGVIIETLKSSGLHVCEYTPLQAKMAVCGYGRATKQQIQKMVQIILGLESLPKPDDAADALALAICCAHSYNNSICN